MRDAGMMRVAGGPRSSSPLLLVRWNLASTVMFVRHSRKQGGTTSRKKNLPHCTPDARHATRRRGDAPSLDEAPRVPAGKPVGPGSGRWLGRVDPTAIGVVNGVVGSRDSVSFSRAGLIQVVGFFFFGQRVESRLRKTTRPCRALSGDRAVQRGLPVYLTPKASSR